jgi:hypothetical protein
VALTPSKKPIKNFVMKSRKFAFVSGSFKNWPIIPDAKIKEGLSTKIIEIFP